MGKSQWDLSTALWEKSQWDLSTALWEAPACADLRWLLPVLITNISDELR
jgi:hypothetical protein